MLGSSRFGGPSQRVTTADTLAPGRYLVGVSTITGASPYVIESSMPFEADVSPRTIGSGSGAVTVGDWTQIPHAGSSLVAFLNWSDSIDSRSVRRPAVRVHVNRAVTPRSLI